MKLGKMILREARHRWANLAGGALGVAAATAVVTGSVAALRIQEEQSRTMMDRLAHGFPQGGHLREDEHPGPGNALPRSREDHACDVDLPFENQPHRAEGPG